MGYQSVTTQSVTTKDENGLTSIVISEITESEGIGLEEKTDYEILDDDQLTEHDFLSLMDSEEEEDEESDSDIDHWFPSLLRTSAIEFLEDNSDLDDEESEAIIEQDSDQEVLNTGKRSSSLVYKYDQRKRTKRSDQVPIEVDYIILADKS